MVLFAGIEWEQLLVAVINSEAEACFANKYLNFSAPRETRCMGHCTNI